MSGSSRDSLKTALEKVERAVQMDRAGRSSQAYSLYMASLDLFLAALKRFARTHTLSLLLSNSLCTLSLRGAKQGHKGADTAANDRVP